MLARTQSGAQAAQNALQGPAIALGCPPSDERQPSAAERGPAVTLQMSDPLGQTALVSFVRVHWVASAALAAAMLAGFYMPLVESTLGSVSHITWELNLAAWLLMFLGGH